MSKFELFRESLRTFSALSRSRSRSRSRRGSWNRGRSPHASLQTVEAELAPIGQPATGWSASMHGGEAAGGRR